MYSLGFDGSIFSIFFLLIVGIIVFSVIRRIVQWDKNNKSPEISVKASIVDKRESKNTTTHYNAGDITGAHGMHTTTDVTYYIKFMVESDEYMEFSVSHSEYNILSKGDEGVLTFKGTRYMSFKYL